MRHRALLVAGLASLATGIIGLILLGSGLLPLTAGGDAAARGEWIFRTGTDPGGRPIPYTGGMMMGVACASCHGSNGRGLRTPMFTSPDITYRNLTDPAGMLEPGGNRGPTYTGVLIRRAVTQGIDAAGKPLAWPMPRWQLTDQEWQDLLAYLKALP
ncbi:MAG: c-type cytochrome [Chloroflexota bacterium]